MTVVQVKKSGRNGERIVAAIRERVFNWEYPPNHPLGEEVLSQEFGVSRSPVREALRTLEAEGLVRRVPNRGYFVRQFKTDEISELFVVRLALEQYAAEYLALHPECHGEVRGLERRWVEIKEGVTTPDSMELARIDESFHTRLVELVGNSMLLEYLQGINARLLVFRSMDFSLVMENGSLQESCQSHIDVVNAILSGNPHAARDAIRANLELGRGNVDKAMGLILARTFNS